LIKKNHLSAELHFNYDESGSLAKFAGKLKRMFSPRLKSTSDSVTIDFYSYEHDNDGKLVKTPLSTGSGSWLSYLEIDGLIYWKINDNVQNIWQSDSLKLPSDSRLRLDSHYIQLKDFERAQIEKDRLENQQRSDNKLKEAYMKKQKKKITKG